MDGLLHSAHREDRYQILNIFSSHSFCPIRFDGPLFSDALHLAAEQNPAIEVPPQRINKADGTIHMAFKEEAQRLLGGSVALHSDLSVHMLHKGMLTVFVLENPETRAHAVWVGQVKGVCHGQIDKEQRLAFALPDIKFPGDGLVISREYLAEPVGFAFPKGVEPGKGICGLVDRFNGFSLNLKRACLFGSPVGMRYDQELAKEITPLNVARFKKRFIVPNMREDVADAYRRKVRENRTCAEETAERPEKALYTVALKPSASFD